MFRRTPPRPLRPTVGNTVGLTTRFPGSYPMNMRTPSQRLDDYMLSENLKACLFPERLKGYGGLARRSTRLDSYIPIAIMRSRVQVPRDVLPEGPTGRAPEEFHAVEYAGFAGAGFRGVT